MTKGCGGGNCNRKKAQDRHTDQVNKYRKKISYLEFKDRMKRARFERDNPDLCRPKLDLPNWMKIPPKNVKYK